MSDTKPQSAAPALARGENEHPGSHAAPVKATSGENFDSRDFRNALGTFGTGVSVTACNDGTPIPAGFVVRQFSTSGVCGDVGVNNQYVLLNLNGEPTGSSTSACTESPIPTGWVISNVSTNFNCD